MRQLSQEDLWQLWDYDWFIVAAWGQPVVFAHHWLVYCAVVATQTLDYFFGGGVPDVDAFVGWAAADVESVDWPSSSDQGFLIALDMPT